MSSTSSRCAATAPTASPAPPGVGPKKAAALLAQYGTLEAMLDEPAASRRPPTTCGSTAGSRRWTPRRRCPSSSPRQPDVGARGRVRRRARARRALASGSPSAPDSSRSGSRRPGRQEREQRERRRPITPARTSVSRGADPVAEEPDGDHRHGHQRRRDQPVEARHAPEQLARDEAVHHRPPDRLAERDAEPGDEAEDDHLPDAGREPVAGDHERRDRPADVHHEHEAPRQAALAVDERRDERAGGGRRVDRRRAPPPRRAGRS